MLITNVKAQNHWLHIVCILQVAQVVSSIHAVPNAVLRVSCYMCRVLLLFSIVAMSVYHINNTQHIT